MPLAEFYRLAKGKLGSSQKKSTTHLSSVADNTFAEIAWENGQIVMQGKSISLRTTYINNTLPSHELPFQSLTLREKDSRNGIDSKIGKFGSMDSVFDDFQPVDEMQPIEEDNILPWANDPIGTSLQQDHYSDFLTELSGVTRTELLTHTNFAPLGKRSTGSNTIKDSHSASLHNGMGVEVGNASKVSSGCVEPTDSKSNQLYPLSPRQCQTSNPSFSSRVSGVINMVNSNSTQNTVFNDSIRNQSSSIVYPSMKIQKQDPGPYILNFSHFSRPAALVRANLESIAAKSAPRQSSVERIVNNKESAVTTLVNSSSGQRIDVGSHSQPKMVPSTDDMKLSTAKLFEEPNAAEQSFAICQEDAFQTDKSQNQIIGSRANTAVADGAKLNVPAVASSVCSGNSMESAYDPTHNLKRKHNENEDTEYFSEDDEELECANRAANARGSSRSKRSRVAEVHNISERRRRDRINEKMRALQELIPNCNKVDKASMLEEVIEYLKTLQLQVQMMSMGTGLCIPVMLPVRMQHMHTAHMPFFSPMGVGMEMAAGSGMSMLDTIGSTGCAVRQMFPMQGACFPVPPISEPSDLHRMAGSNPSVFGIHGQPFLMPRPPLVPYSAVNHMMPAMLVNASRLGGPVGDTHASHPVDSRQSSGTLEMQNTDVDGLLKKRANQL